MGSADRNGRSKLDLRDEPFVGLAAAEDFVAQVPFEVSSPAHIRALASAGLSVALMAMSAAQTPCPPVVVHPWPGAPAHPPIGLIHRRDHRFGPAPAALRQHLLAAADASVPPGGRVR